MTITLTAEQHGRLATARTLTELLLDLIQAAYPAHDDDQRDTLDRAAALVRTIEHTLSDLEA